MRVATHLWTRGASFESAPGVDESTQHRQRPTVYTDDLEAIIFSIPALSRYLS